MNRNLKLQKILNFLIPIYSLYLNAPPMGLQRTGFFDDFRTLSNQINYI